VGKASTPVCLVQYLLTSVETQCTEASCSLLQALISIKFLLPCKSREEAERTLITVDRYT